MKQFEYTVKDSLGIHARPAGLIAKLAKQYSADTNITVSCNGREAAASALMRLMSLGVKQGQTVTVKAEGPAEDKAAAELEEFFQKNL